MILQDEGTKHLNSAKTNTIPKQSKGRLAFPYQSAEHRGYPAKRIRLPCRTEARWNNPAPKGEQLATARQNLHLQPGRQTPWHSSCIAPPLGPRWNPLGSPDEKRRGGSTGI